MFSDHLAGLNPEQLRAVTLAQGSALVLAGAGSGKTRVLTTRIAWLIAGQRAMAANILAVTFTNKAAREMHTRLSVMLPINPRGMWIGTFHGLSNRFLRTHWRDAGLPQTFAILDMQDQLAAIKRLMKSLQVSDEKFPPRQVQAFINSHKDQGLRAEALKPHDAFNAKLTELYAAYDAQCRREGVVDFAELLLRSYELLSNNEALREHYRARFSHILVDEFQDTNKLQYAWLTPFAGPHASVFAVGDDDQSIYAFRGAEVGNMRRLMADFQVAEPIKLEQNYRSCGNILDAANALIQHNDGRLGKNLWTDAGAGEPVRLYRGWTDGNEAEFIVDEVRALRRDGHALANMAVLYRSNAQSRVLEHALFQAGLPYRVYGGLRFFERQEIKHALAYLRLVASPEDDNALLRVINVPARGIGARTVENLQTASRERGVSLWQAACGQGGGRSAASLGKFVLLIEQLRQDALRLSFAQLVSHLIDFSGLRAMYQSDKDGGEERLENLDELISAAVSFAPEDPAQIIAEFLAHASLEAGEHQAGAGEDAFQLMTVHAAKGLEFDCVFVSGLEEGLFPHENALNDRHGIEEERRLMYVAITRARQRLYLTQAQQRMLHGQTRYPLPSRFMDEIPPALTKNLSESMTAGLSSRHAPATTRAPAARSSGPARQELPGGWRIGQSVAHPKFGVGVILNAEALGEELRLYVNFAEHGAKWLDMRFAKLTPA
ncbi:DNA helicase II [Aquaspirillum sp. LM1]|uniref:UvrD-helicase domain-containing protein n=1 Tax=Aquaspirillum sp. LM1 TaxID=1938604 RepID=UPI000983E414|nr:UvrD-helicase domain-containing protein [Aquaspirillum sp. LM1]AQR63758.1 DNA helicase II [Aquaspirillum sp. LM1]